VSEHEHVGENAELYALGALDDFTRTAIDRHGAGCLECTRLLGSAEEHVARMAAAEPSRELPAILRQRLRLHAPSARAGWPAWTALAAALLLATVPSAYFWQQTRVLHEAMSVHADAMDRLAGSSVRSATFTPMTGGATARVMYAPDGSWYVVLVRGASAALDVAWMHDGRRTMLGTARSYGDLAMLYLPKSHRMDQLALVDGPRVVAEAQLAF